MNKPPKSLLLIGDTVLFKYKNNLYSDSVYNADFWQRYLNVFNTLEVLTQTINLYQLNTKHRVSNARNVSFIEIDRYSKWTYLFAFNELSNAIDNKVSSKHAIVRLPSIIGFLSIFYLRKNRINYYLEIVADPLTAYRRRPIIAIAFCLLMKYQVSKAIGVSYVTKNALQKRYPSSRNSVIANYSSISLNNNDLIKSYNQLPLTINFLHVSNVIGNYLKGHDIFLKTIKILRDSGINLHASIVGDGPYLNKIKLMALKYSLEGVVDFVGFVSDEDKLLRFYYNSDIFLFPSRAEGLPRVLIQAASMGLVAFSSNVGGISEILPFSQISIKNNPKEYARIISEVIQNLDRLRLISMNQIERSKEFDREFLQAKRDYFYSSLIDN